MAATDTNPGTDSIRVPATNSHGSDSRAEPGRLAAAGRRVRRDPQRDDDGRRDPPPDGGSRHHRAAGAVADDIVHADDGRHHPDHGLPAAAVHDARHVRDGDEPLLGGHADRDARAGLPGPARRPRGAGLGHGDHDAAADDDDHDRRAGAVPRPHDGPRQRRDLARARDRPDALRLPPRHRRLAGDLRRRAADRARSRSGPVRAGSTISARRPRPRSTSCR